jgi:hypothetical protein
VAIPGSSLSPHVASNRHDPRANNCMHELLNVLRSITRRRWREHMT